MWPLGAEGTECGKSSEPRRIPCGIPLLFGRILMDWQGGNWRELGNARDMGSERMENKGGKLSGGAGRTRKARNRRGTKEPKPKPRIDASRIFYSPSEHVGNNK